MKIAFKNLYSKVEPIVLNCSKQYNLSNWRIVDWKQEGELVLYNLLLKQPSLVYTSEFLPLCFRITFHRHIISIINSIENKE
ncbi:hypothetical protein [Streptococcus massiliensis]|uniref:Competence-specific global transcription modulator n=1 Tax=Streptococcus massiliensis TaxID=313439 RepID=A0A380KYX6_9STRE|nr:hypothetical protein [Streptococcus massiliensis]SUN76284.1 competence-specific global transcription modulator [Streptococcus massiliensis]